MVRNRPPELEDTPEGKLAAIGSGLIHRKCSDCFEVDYIDLRVAFRKPLREIELRWRIEEARICQDELRAAHLERELASHLGA